MASAAAKALHSGKSPMIAKPIQGPKHNNTPNRLLLRPHLMIQGINEDLKMALFSSIVLLLSNSFATADQISVMAPISIPPIMAIVMPN